MPKFIFVEPAKGLLVAYESHRPGQYIGVRHATPAEREDGKSIIAEAFEGHAYVKAEPPFAQVVDSPYYQRHILDVALKLISSEAAAKHIETTSKRHAADAEKAKAEAAKAAKSAPSEAVAAEETAR